MLDVESRLQSCLRTTNKGNLVALRYKCQTTIQHPTNPSSFSYTYAFFCSSTKKKKKLMLENIKIVCWVIKRNCESVPDNGVLLFLWQVIVMVRTKGWWYMVEDAEGLNSTTSAYFINISHESNKEINVVLTSMSWIQHQLLLQNFCFFFLIFC